MPIIELLNTLWITQMDKNFKRAEEVRLKYAPTEILTKYSTGLLQASMNHADFRYRTVHFRSADPIQAVVQGFKRDHYLVNFATQSCTCGLFEFYSVPCGHAVACLRALRPQKVCRSVRTRNLNHTELTTI